MTCSVPEQSFAGAQSRINLTNSPVCGLTETDPCGCLQWSLTFDSLCPVNTGVPKSTGLPLANKVQMNPWWPRAASALMSALYLSQGVAPWRAGGGFFLFSWRCYGRQIIGGLTAAANSDHPKGDSLLFSTAETLQAETRLISILLMHSKFSIIESEKYEILGFLGRSSYILICSLYFLFITCNFAFFTFELVFHWTASGRASV